MASYYLARDGKSTGPFDAADVLSQVAGGTIGRNDLCWREGMADWQPLSTVLDVATGRAIPLPGEWAPVAVVAPASPLFLYIPVARLVMLSILTFSIYDSYWIYRNWRYVKERDDLQIRPFWRGVFGVFFCHGLLRRIHEDEEARTIQPPAFSPDTLATGWVVLVILSNVLSRWTTSVSVSILVAFIPSWLCFVPVQRYVNAVSERRSPGQPYYGWSWGHVVCLVLGSLFWGLVLLTLLIELVDSSS